MTPPDNRYDPEVYVLTTYSKIITPPSQNSRWSNIHQFVLSLKKQVTTDSRIGVVGPHNIKIKCFIFPSYTMNYTFISNLIKLRFFKSDVVLNHKVKIHRFYW